MNSNEEKLDYVQQARKLSAELEAFAEQQKALQMEFLKQTLLLNMKLLFYIKIMKRYVIFQTMNMQIQEVLFQVFLERMITMNFQNIKRDQKIMCLMRLILYTKVYL